MKINSILLAALFLSTTLAVQAGSVVNQYFPMNNGDSRYYQDYDFPSSTSTEYFTQTSYNGHSVFSLNFHDEWNTTSLETGTWYLGNSGTALTLYGIKTSWGSLTFNSPANLFTDQTLTNNGALTSTVTGVYYAAGLGNVTFNITVQTTVSSIPGTITVPAGTFANCKLVEVVETATCYGVFQQTFDSAAWVLAPGVGIIADGVATWDVDTGTFTFYDLFGNEEDYFELVSVTYNPSTKIPAITSPIPGSTLTSSSVTFQWSSGTGVTNYGLYVGSSFDAHDIYDQSVGMNLSGSVTGIPTDGRTLYVRLWWTIAGVWQYTDYTNTASSTPPSATTKAATLISTSGATLNSTVNPNGLSTTIHFEYGLTASYGTSTTLGNIGTSASNYGAAITGLSPNTTYHFRIVATSSGGTRNGSDMTFKTTASSTRRR